MAKSVPAALFQGEAYRLFCQELDLRIAELATCLSADSVALEAGALSANFHRLKGGSGFFGLEEISLIAAELEDLFSREGGISSEQPVIDRARERLLVCQRAMPVPSGGHRA